MLTATLIANETNKYTINRCFYNVDAYYWCYHSVAIDMINYDKGTQNARVGILLQPVVAQ